MKIDAQQLEGQRSNWRVESIKSAATASLFPTQSTSMQKKQTHQKTPTCAVTHADKQVRPILGPGRECMARWVSRLRRGAGEGKRPEGFLNGTSMRRYSLPLMASVRGKAVYSCCWIFPGISWHTLCISCCWYFPRTRGRFRACIPLIRSIVVHGLTKRLMGHTQEASVPLLQAATPCACRMAPPSRFWRSPPWRCTQTPRCCR